MRFVLAIVAFVVAALMIGFGVAQRTILAEPDRVTLSTTVDSDATVTVIDGATLNAFEGSQTLTVSGSGEVFAAYGRTSDVLAWIGDTTYTAVSRDPETGELVSETVTGTETEVPDPNGSDLWLDDYVKDEDLTLTVNVPDNISFLIASDGVEPAPADIAIAWPIDNSTPWAGPLIVGGAIVLLVGIGFLIWAIHHMRSTRGPRRKMPKVPKKPVYKPARKPVESAASGRRRGMIAVPIALVSLLALSGCSPEFWPGGGTGPTPEPSASVPAGSELKPPAVTVRQVERIVARISAVTAEADANRDAELLKTRFDGPALELRLANYTIRGLDPAAAALPAIPEGPVRLTLPQQTDTWPRTVLAVIQDDKDATIPPVALILEQPDPRSDYKVTYAITLEASAVLPDVAPASVGAARLPADTGLLSTAPSALAEAYGEILMEDVDADSYLDFEAEGDTLRTSVGLDAKNQLRGSLPTTASMAFTNGPGPGDTIALATNDAGAIVAVNLLEATTVTPVEAGAAINPTGQVKTLSGIAVSQKGVVATYSDQLLFYVPPAGSDGKIILLGYSTGLVTATEIG
ncbi:hypothetical protein [Antiquaquibacter soli]|uniref:DUF8094 domain-containing protein n=1 Tax=Antiquaquibacter soli TaxID=3064523 RepID=A0ABT9BN85_9MICO|nr:hypothetical protein [Protaetiibacter sp. WY-16]MDO7882470.1 hypothetical protein [Protaetiibacter sp. WY-16]